jgi:hypothetical protein
MMQNNDLPGSQPKFCVHAEQATPQPGEIIRGAKPPDQPGDRLRPVDISLGELIEHFIRISAGFP